jgi:hypothetical protein
MPMPLKIRKTNKSNNSKRLYRLSNRSTVLYKARKKVWYYYVRMILTLNLFFYVAITRDLDYFSLTVDELMEEKEALLQKFEEEKVSRHDTSL